MNWNKNKSASQLRTPAKRSDSLRLSQRNEIASILTCPIATASTTASRVMLEANRWSVAAHRSNDSPPNEHLVQYVCVFDGITGNHLADDSSSAHRALSGYACRTWRSLSPRGPNQPQRQKTNAHKYSGHRGWWKTSKGVSSSDGLLGSLNLEIDEK